MNSSNQDGLVLRKQLIWFLNRWGKVLIAILLMMLDASATLILFSAPGIQKNAGYIYDDLLHITSIVTVHFFYFIFKLSKSYRRKILSSLLAAVNAAKQIRCLTFLTFSHRILYVGCCGLELEYFPYSVEYHTGKPPQYFTSCGSRHSLIVVNCIGL